MGPRPFDRGNSEEYPNYRSLEPDPSYREAEYGRLEVDVEEIRRIAAAAEAVVKDPVLVLELGPRVRARIAARGFAGHWQVIERARWEPGAETDLRVGVNPRYLQDALDAVGGGPVWIRDACKPLYFAWRDRYALVMPVRLPPGP